ncbi:hypothetical protein [Methanimicrococcus hongohii]|uniref:hypothetical protein n=1 Tax=Methanimicrococcus hongohii TaxID=3028295 RepID=UPI0029313329|nr:hypothetical protein [Methanimicrococcus sp. Hf6]
MKRSFKFLSEAKKRDLADSFPCETKIQKTFRYFDCFPAMLSLPISNCSLLLSVPAEPANQQLFFTDACPC